MAAGGPARRPRTGAGARGWGRTDSRGSAFPERQRPQRPPGRSAKGFPEGERPQTASAEPAREEPAEARRRQRGGPGTPSVCSSRRAAGKRPPKRLKSEKPAPVKPEELTGRSESLAALGEEPKPSDGDQRSEDTGDCSLIQKEKGESSPELNEDKQQKEQDALPEPHAVKSSSEQDALPEPHAVKSSSEQDALPEPHAVKSSSAPAKLGSDEHLHIYSEEERSCQSLLSDESSLGDADVPRRLMELDSSALLNEDSNQPMPVARFFGDLELLRDQPAAALPTTMMSRREFRKLHIIAKEEEEEEEEDVV